MVFVLKLRQISHSNILHGQNQSYFLSFHASVDIINMILQCSFNLPVLHAITVSTEGVDIVMMICVCNEDKKQGYFLSAN